jgi:O-antigen/teichoic acid export membrane protein
MSEAESYGRYMVRGGAVIFISHMAAGFFALLLRILLARSLSVVEYGTFYATFYFVSFFALFRELGLTSAIVKFLPEFSVRRDRHAIAATIRFVLLLQVVIVGIISSIILIFSPQIALGFVGDEKATDVVRILAVWLFVSVFYSTLLSIFQGLRDMTAYAWTNAGWDALILVSAIPLLNVIHLGASGAALAYVLGTLLISLAALVYMIVKHGEIAFSEPAPLETVSRTILSFSIPIFIGSIWGMMTGYIDTWAVSLLRGAEEVGYYQVVHPTARFFLYFASAITIPLFPMVAELWSKGAKTLLSKLVHFIFKFSLIVITPFVFILLAFPEAIIQVFFGEKYIVGALALQIFAISVMFSLFYKIFGTILAGLGKAKLCVVVSFITCIVSVCSNVVFVSLIGMEGAALSSLFVNVVGCALYARFFMQYIEFSFPTFPAVKTAIGSILALFLIYLLKSILVLPVLAELVVVIFVAFCFYVGWIVVARIISRDELSFLTRVVPLPRCFLSILKRCFDRARSS